MGSSSTFIWATGNFHIRNSGSTEIMRMSRSWMIRNSFYAQDGSLYVFPRRLCEGGRITEEDRGEDVRNMNISCGPGSMKLVFGDVDKDGGRLIALCKNARYGIRRMRCRVCIAI